MANPAMRSPNPALQPPKFPNSMQLPKLSSPARRRLKLSQPATQLPALQLPGLPNLDVQVSNPELQLPRMQLTTPAAQLPQCSDAVAEFAQPGDAAAQSALRLPKLLHPAMQLP